LAVDIALIAIDLVDIGRNGLNLSNGVSLAGNLVGAAVPFATGLGKIVSSAVESSGRASKTEIHHVVPQADKRAAEARDVMQSQGINPKTDPSNKVPLTGDKHDITKRDSYVRDTNQRVAAQPTADAIKAECCRIGENLQKSTLNELNNQYPAK
jgi:hypothetical protein